MGEVLCLPHLMLANIGNHDGVVGRDLIQHRHRLRRDEDPIRHVLQQHLVGAGGAGRLPPCVHGRGR